MKEIHASAPGKLMLFGEHAVVYDRPCIVTAVDQRVYVTVQPTSEPIFVLNSPDLNAYIKPLQEIGKGEIPRAAQFVEKFVYHWSLRNKLNSGLIITTRSDFSPKFGFGSSSAVTAALCVALVRLFGLNVDRLTQFHWCYETVLDVQGVGSGFDLAAALWGGTIYYVQPAKRVQELSVRKIPIRVVYSGIKADTVQLVHQVRNYFDSEPSGINEIFDHIASIVEKARYALDEGQWKEVGQLMNDNQLLLEQLNVSTTRLDHLISEVRKCGALGSKISGAGGGDCIIAISEESKLACIKDAVRLHDGQLIYANIAAEGARLES